MYSDKLLSRLRRLLFWFLTVRLRLLDWLLGLLMRSDNFLVLLLSSWGDLTEFPGKSILPPLRVPLVLACNALTGEGKLYLLGVLILEGVWPQAWLAIKTLQWKKKTRLKFQNYPPIYPFTSYLSVWSLKKFTKFKGYSFLNAERCSWLYSSRRAFGASSSFPHCKDVHC